MKNLNYDELTYMSLVEKQVKYTEEKERKNESAKKCYEKRKEKLKKERNETKDGRAKMLISAYKKQDLEKGRGECELTEQQLIQLWDEGCYYCGEKDWHKLGADRIDNKRIHSLSNCVCCCKDCNTLRGTSTFGKFLEKLKRIKNTI